VQTEVFNLIKRLAFETAPDPGHPLWRLTPFIDYPRESLPGQAASTYDWRWEREWRVRGSVTFEADDVALLFAPERHHRALGDWWLDEMIDGWGGFMPPTLDPRWPRAQQEAAAAKGPRTVAREVAEPVELWWSEEEDLRPIPLGNYRDDETVRNAEMLDEIRGWLAEMARDDI